MIMMKNFQRKYEDILALVERGMGIAEACKRKGIDRASFYHAMTPQQYLKLFQAKMTHSIQGNSDSLHLIGIPEGMQRVDPFDRNDLHEYFATGLGSENNPFAWDGNLESFQISQNT